MRQFVEQSSLVVLGLILGYLICLGYMYSNHVEPRDSWVKSNFGTASTFDLEKRTYVYRTSEEKPIPSLKEIVQFQVNKILSDTFTYNKKRETKVNNDSSQ